MKRNATHNHAQATAVETLLTAHPHRLDLRGLGDAVQACLQCADVCAACADLLMTEEKLSHFRRAMRAALDCADVCSATARILSRQTDPDLIVIRDQIIACATAAKTAGEHCAAHSDRHPYCTVVATTCQRCEASCRSLLEVLPLDATS